jgi:hypothetical protein
VLTALLKRDRNGTFVRAKSERKLRPNLSLKVRSLPRVHLVYLRPPAKRQNSWKRP